MNQTVDWNQYSISNPGDCGSCRYHEWNRIEHRTYCRNPESWEHGQFKRNDESCDKYETAGAGR